MTERVIKFESSEWKVMLARILTSGDKENVDWNNVEEMLIKAGVSLPREPVLNLKSLEDIVAGSGGDDEV